MLFIISTISFIAGVAVGALVYRNNAKRLKAIEDEAKRFTGKLR